MLKNLVFEQFMDLGWFMDRPRHKYVSQETFSCLFTCKVDESPGHSFDGLTL